MIGLPKPIRERDDSYLSFVRSQSCLIAKYHKCEGPIDPHHVIPDGHGKVGSKVSDRRAVALCRKAHDLARRRDFFEETFPVSFEEEILRLNKLYVPPLGTRSVRPSCSRVRSTVVDCVCGRRHKLNPAKFTIRGKTLRFWCTTQREYRSAEL